MMKLLEIKNKRGLVLNRGITTDYESYIQRFKRLHESINVSNDCLNVSTNLYDTLDISIIEVNVSYDSLLKNKFVSRFDIDELKQVKFLPLSSHLYKIIKYNY